MATLFVLSGQLHQRAATEVTCRPLTRGHGAAEHLPSHGSAGMCVCVWGVGVSHLGDEIQTGSLHSAAPAVTVPGSDHALVWCPALKRWGSRRRGDFLSRGHVTAAGLILTSHVLSPNVRCLFSILDSSGAASHH